MLRRDRKESEKVRKVCGEGDPTDEPGKIKMDLSRAEGTWKVTPSSVRAHTEEPRQGS